MNKSLDIPMTVRLHPRSRIVGGTRRLTEPLREGRIPSQKV